MSIHPPIRTWFKSSRSATQSECVEVYLDAEAVGVRDSTQVGHGPELWFTGEQWDVFLRSGIWQH
ncbi:DUF397 domain-containing protein [Nocardia yamanashiensis]|uniref:DUF397 domain-containing protein n=1 Tax=Nocardia yamanashiensis TaxID=209247 RepID=UPI0008301634|nr:DUF397 domain-containing protein [Nocardia yamanashiensis]